MCTSNTLMKIETRVYSAVGEALRPGKLAGGGTLAIIVISPSAGATMKLSPRGVVRIGSRKKANDPDGQADQQPADEFPAEQRMRTT